MTPTHRRLAWLATILSTAACSSTPQRPDANASKQDALADVLPEGNDGSYAEVARDTGADRVADLAVDLPVLLPAFLDANAETGSAVDAGTGASSDTDLQVLLSLVGGELVYRRGALSLELTPSCPAITIDGVVFSSSAPSLAGGTPPGENRVEFVCTMSGDHQTTLAVTVHYEVSSKDGNLRKWASIVPSGFPEGALLQKVILDSLDTGVFGPAKLTDLGDTHQSFPAFFDGFFAAVEYPMAQTYLDQGRVVLSHRPGQHISNGQLLGTRTAVFSLTPSGQARRYFDDYLASVRPKSAGMHVTYDTWWSLPYPYTEQEVMGLLGSLKDNLSTPYGVSFDSFCLDLGWTAPQGIWEINQAGLPNGLSKIKEMADSMHTALGLWFSPANLYSPFSFDNVWAQQNGYEAGPSPLKPEELLSLCTVKGGKYQQRLRDVFVEYIKKYQIGMLKVDGMVLTCDQPNHGHPTGGYEMEFIADGLIEVFQAALQANPDLWIEATCFTPNPSPFWLLYVSSVLGAYGDGDDSPRGLIPAPTYRESYTTARDHYNLQGSDRLAAPVRYQDVLGLIHQTTDDFTNDAIMSAFRGNDFLAVYANPTDGMSTERWAKLAAILQWARGMQPTLHGTQTLRPRSWSDLGGTSLYEKDTMPREPYGYAHWAADGGVIGLRNPWIARAFYTVQVPSGAGHWYATSLYPEERYYGEVDQGGHLDVPLAPYETLVLSFLSQPPRSDLPTVVGGAKGPLVASPGSFSATPVPGGVAYALSDSVETTAKKTTLMLIFEGANDVTLPSDIVIAVNNTSISYETAPSHDGWTSTSQDPSAFWNIVSADIPAGKQSLAISFTDPPVTGGSVSGWLLATKSGKPTQSVASLPQPEALYLDSVQLF